jgi:hypothetical protein
MAVSLERTRLSLRSRSDRFVVVVVTAIAVLACLANVAWAYSNDPDLACSSCHGNNAPKSPDTETSGPHGGYSTTSDNCQTCHTVHEGSRDASGNIIPGSILLLPATTIKDTCLTCHDATGAGGVYGNIDARGLAVESSHSVEATSLVPGGDAATGGSIVATFSGAGNTLTCDDCHSPHGSGVVTPFLGDRMRGVDDTRPVVSSKLLKIRPTGSEATATVYGSDWCGTCHRGRLSGGVVHNHPADSSATTATPFDYSHIAAVVSTTSLETTMAGMGRNNRGYVMPAPRSVEQTGHAPICQQCHEDARDVGVPGQVATYTVTAPYGLNEGDNPQFQDFPHESTNPSMLIERNDDLCLNCHPTAELP